MLEFRKTILLLELVLKRRGDSAKLGSGEALDGGGPRKRTDVNTADKIAKHGGLNSI